MAVDPVLFEKWEEKHGVKLPDLNVPILFRKKNGEMGAGIVSRVWWCEDTTCINVYSVDGIKHIFWEFGDRWTTKVPEGGENGQ